MTTIDIPKEGLKLVAILGYVEDKPIWRQVGKLIVNRKGNPQVILDLTVNINGAKTEEDSPYLQCAVKEFSPEEAEKQRGYNRNKTVSKKRSPSISSSFSDMDDDIPF